MAEIEDRLRNRRAQILTALENRSFTESASPQTQQVVREMLQELAAIEQTLTQIDATNAQKDETARRRDEDLARDDATFWLRRFMVSLQIGNGAAFLAILAGLSQQSDWPAAAAIVRGPAWAFGFGLLLAGAVPFALWFDRRYKSSGGDTIGPWLASLAAAFFAIGLIGTMVTVEDLAKHRLPAPVASSAPQTPAPRR